MSWRDIGKGNKTTKEKVNKIAMYYLDTPPLTNQMN